MNFLPKLVSIVTTVAKGVAITEYFATQHKYAIARGIRDSAAFLVGRLPSGKDVEYVLQSHSGAPFIELPQRDYL